MMRSTRRSCCGVEVQAAEVGGGVGVVEPAAHGVLERLGLLVNLLEHVVLEVALVGVAGVPVDVRGRWRRRASRSCVEDVPVVRRQHAQLVVLQVDDLVGVADQGAGIAGQEVLALADAERPAGCRGGRRRSGPG